MSTRPVYLGLEFVFLFIALPLIYLSFRRLLHPVPVIWCIAALCAYLLKRDGYFENRRFLGGCPSRKQVLIILGRFVFSAVIIGLFTAFYEPGRFLIFPKTRPILWLIIILLYPFLSAFPQGIIYRAFIFHRYKGLFGTGWGMMAVSGIVFSYAHIIFLNPVAPILTLAGGILFAHTYQKSASLWFSSAEHALYGDLIFTVGLGHYIYSGAPAIMR